MSSSSAGDKMIETLNTEEGRGISSLSVRNNMLALTDDNGKFHLYHINYYN